MAKSASLLVLAALVAGSLGAQASDAALIEAAKKEGALTVYACDPPQTPLYVNRFKQLFPDIAVTTYVAGCWEPLNMEARASARRWRALEGVVPRQSPEPFGSARAGGR